MIKVKQAVFILAIFVISSLLFTGNTVLSEDLPSGSVIPKLPKTANDPTLFNNKVYPFWGPVCQRYTYSVIYSDKEGRAPEYVQIYFNGKMLDMEKEDPSANDYKKGVKYIFQNVPKKFGSNFYYFEASNGLGKTRASIIDSPDNGPVLFDADFKHNEIVLIDGITGKESWRYFTGEEWVGAVVLSDDGQYLAAQTSNHIYFFDTDKGQPIWDYESLVSGAIGGDVKGGVAISADGQKIFAALNGKALMFDKNSNKPVWTYNLEANGGGAYGVDISQNGQYMAVAMAGSESDQNSNVLILFDAKGKKLWQYHSSGNWHEVNFSADGSYLVGSTGCPDRRGYLFSKDSAEPIIKSDPLSKESPIDEASISADGNLVVYGVESGYGAIVLMDKDTKQIVWKYETHQGRSVRALAMTPSGEFIGAGTFGGDILIFNKNSNKTIEQLKINSAIGAFDIADEGSFFAVGSADKKVRVYEKGAGKAKAEVILNEYVGEIDISGNGKFIVAGTSGAVYFFETLVDLNNIQTSACKEIIEPPTENTSLFGGQNGGNAVENNNGDVIDDNMVDVKAPLALSVFITIVGAGLFFVLLVIYILFCHTLGLPYKKIFIIAGIFLILASLGAAFYFWKDQKIADRQDIIKNTMSGESICGDGLCEPDRGESINNCFKDCLNNQ